MLSYDTKKMDSLISKLPPDMPKDLIPNTKVASGFFEKNNTTTIATKVPEDAGMAAVEKPHKRSQTNYVSLNSYKQEIRPSSDALIKETSDAILRGIPEVLHDPYRVKLSHAESNSSNSKGQWVGEPMTMSRMEYIQYVREQCEKELCYVPKRPSYSISLDNEEAKEDTMEKVSALEMTKDLVQPTEALEKAEQKVEGKLPLVLKENLEEEMIVEARLDSKKRRFLRILWIRFIIALCLFIGLVSFDLLNVHFGSTGIHEVKDVVANNSTIQKIEKIVSDFTENTVLPVFGIDKEDGQ